MNAIHIILQDGQCTEYTGLLTQQEISEISQSSAYNIDAALACGVFPVNYACFYISTGKFCFVSASYAEGSVIQTAYIFDNFPVFNTGSFFLSNDFSPNFKALAADIYESMPSLSECIDFLSKQPSGLLQRLLDIFFTSYKRDIPVYMIDTSENILMYMNILCQCIPAMMMNKVTFSTYQLSSPTAPPFRFFFSKRNDGQQYYDISGDLGMSGVIICDMHSAQFSPNIQSYELSSVITSLYISQSEDFGKLKDILDSCYEQNGSLDLDRVTDAYKLLCTDSFSSMTAERFCIALSDSVVTSYDKAYVQNKIDTYLDENVIVRNNIGIYAVAYRYATDINSFMDNVIRMMLTNINEKSLTYSACLDAADELFDRSMPSYFTNNYDSFTDIIDKSIDSSALIKFVTGLLIRDFKSRAETKAADILCVLTERISMLPNKDAEALLDECTFSSVLFKKMYSVYFSVRKRSKEGYKAYIAYTDTNRYIEGIEKECAQYVIREIKTDGSIKAFIRDDDAFALYILNKLYNLYRSDSISETELLSSTSKCFYDVLHDSTNPGIIKYMLKTSYLQQDYFNKVLDYYVRQLDSALLNKAFSEFLTESGQNNDILSMLVGTKAEFLGERVICAGIANKKDFISYCSTWYVENLYTACFSRTFLSVINDTTEDKWKFLSELIHLCSEVLSEYNYVKDISLVCNEFNECVLSYIQTKQDLLKPLETLDSVLSSHNIQMPIVLVFVLSMLRYSKKKSILYTDILNDKSTSLFMQALTSASLNKFVICYSDVAMNMFLETTNRNVQDNVIRLFSAINDESCLLRVAKQLNKFKRKKRLEIINEMIIINNDNSKNKKMLLITKELLKKTSVKDYLAIKEGVERDYGKTRFSPLFDSVEKEFCILKKWWLKRVLRKRNDFSSSL